MILRPCKPRDVRHIAPRLRHWDRVEAAAFGRSPTQALELGRIASTWSATVVIDGRPEGMLGVTPADVSRGLGTPWFLGTEAVLRQHRAWSRYSPWAIKLMLSHFPHLANHVACGNVRARAWLSRCGFRFDDTAQEVGGVAMLRFWMNRLV